MSIRKGLRYGDDEPDPHIIEKTKFEADRKKTNFEKDMDSLLFGGGPAPPRRRRPAQTGAAQQKKPSPPKVQQQSKTTLPIVSTVKNTAPAEGKSQINKPKQSNKQNTSIQSNTSSIKQKPVPKVDNYVTQKKQDPFKQSPSSIVIEQPKNQRQMDTDQTHYKVSSIRYNQPAFIRKLRKVAQDFNFHIQNGVNHVAHQVVRPSECVKQIVVRDNVQGFEDREFPPQSYCIGPQYRSQLVIWKKPSQIYKSPVFGKYIQPNDIEPGKMSSPQFLSTLSCLAQRQQNIKRLIENQKINQNGFYYVRLNINGVWRYITVDDNLPQLNGQPLGVRSHNDSQAQLWPAIIQKAYAKAYQGYITFNQNTPRQHFLHDLTGAPVKKYNPKGSNISWVIGDALQKGWPVLAVPKEKITEIGFNPNYSLTVLKCNSKGALELRSSWGTISQRPKVSLGKQGMFQLSSTQASDYISHILIAETDDLKTTTIQSKHYGSFYSCFNFNLSHASYGTISINQFDRRMFSVNSEYDYVPFRVVLQMKNATQDGGSAYINAAFSHHSRNLDLPINLNPGSYYLYCIGQWPNQPYDFDVTIHARDHVQIKKIYYNNFPNILAEALTEQVLSKGKRSAKGHVDEYILYHQQSNLVLITAHSLVDKPYKFTLNLGQVKFDQLTLLNTAYPEDNFSKKSRNELDDLKNSYFNNKTWDVDLLPQENYTWVFSSSQDYDQNNFKAWGFK